MQRQSLVILVTSKRYSMVFCYCSTHGVQFGRFLGETSQEIYLLRRQILTDICFHLPTGTENIHVLSIS